MTRLGWRVKGGEDTLEPRIDIGRLTQRLECLPYTEEVGGSNPSSPTNLATSGGAARSDRSEEGRNAPRISRAEGRASCRRRLRPSCAELGGRTGTRRLRRRVERLDGSARGGRAPHALRVTLGATRARSIVGLTLTSLTSSRSRRGDEPTSRRADVVRDRLTRHSRARQGRVRDTQRETTEPSATSSSTLPRVVIRSVRAARIGPWHELVHRVRSSESSMREATQRYVTHSRALRWRAHACTRHTPRARSDEARGSTHARAMRHQRRQHSKLQFRRMRAR